MRWFDNAVRVTAASFVLALGASGAAGAQSLPSYASPDTAPPAPAPLPSYATKPQQATPQELVTGRISAIPDKYELEVRDAKGYVDRIRLHDGTIITPVGLKLAVGMTVRVFGANKGEVFEANQIDAPYSIYGGSNGPWRGYPGWR